ncbi:MAG TPA: hypothetical protein VM032_06885 [Vicinamibacterales bacterium]|nr:hypothetical protein [Vicinamibacterales bacterium]
MGWRQPSAGPGARTARLAGAALVSVVGSVGAVYLLLPLLTRALVRALTLTVNGCVWLAASMSAGADPWTILSAVGRAAGDTLATRQVSAVLLALAVVGGLAFYWLQRLLGSDEESSQ